VILKYQKYFEKLKEEAQRKMIEKQQLQAQTQQTSNGTAMGAITSNSSSNSTGSSGSGMTGITSHPSNPSSSANGGVGGSGSVPISSTRGTVPSHNIPHSPSSSSHPTGTGTTPVIAVGGGGGGGLTGLSSLAGLNIPLGTANKTAAHRPHLHPSTSTLQTSLQRQHRHDNHHQQHVVASSSGSNPSGTTRSK
jgi:hypothetical protein